MTPITVKREKKPTKKGQICKEHENWFYENCFFQEKETIRGK